MKSALSDNFLMELAESVLAITTTVLEYISFTHGFKWIQQV